MNTPKNKSDNDAAKLVDDVAETTSISDVKAVPAEADSEVTDGGIVKSAIEQESGQGAQELSAVKHLRRVTDNTLLKSLLNCYLHGGFESETVRSAMRLAMSDGGAEEMAIRHLRGVTANPTLKFLLTRYQNGDLQSGGAQAALRLVVSDADRETNAAVYLRDLTESLLLKTFLNYYLNGQLSKPSVQAAVRRALPKSQRATDSERQSEEDMSAAAPHGNQRETTMNASAVNRFVAINSFPKSGNTWIRSFISHLCFAGSLSSVPDKYRENILDAPVYRLPDGTSVRFYKSHDITLANAFRDRRIEHAAVIHIRRHPLDIFFSYLNFIYLTPSGGQASQSAPHSVFLNSFSGVDEIVERDLLDAFFGVFLLFGTLNPHAQAGSWYDNMRYWSRELEMECPVFRLRYEDLLANQAKELYAVGRFLGKSEDEVERAFLAAQKVTAVDGRFFWKQRSGIYKELLSARLIEKYDSLFGNELKSYGYSL